MSTTRNNEKFGKMGWKNGAKDIMKFESAAFVGYEVKEVIDSTGEKKTKSEIEEKIISKLIEKSLNDEKDDFSISNVNVIIMIIFLIIAVYLIVKHVTKRRTNENAVRV